ncbi:hypothetical protein C8R45DRAFT_1210669 [Mycena sanguinolenta]|nr:hypothetical protein C8R45DRAFT_1210669 [Mycena sanguinolenta]
MPRMFSSFGRPRAIDALHASSYRGRWSIPRVFPSPFAASFRTVSCPPLIISCSSSWGSTVVCWVTCCSSTLCTFH